VEDVDAENSLLRLDQGRKGCEGKQLLGVHLEYVGARKSLCRGDWWGEGL
jgi:hypothetical protein